MPNQNRMNSSSASNCARADKTAQTTIPLVMTVLDAAKCAGIGRTKIYEEIKAGRLKTRKCGRRTLVTKHDFKAWLHQLPKSNEVDCDDPLKSIGRALLEKPPFARYVDGVLINVSSDCIGVSIEDECGNSTLYLVKEWLANRLGLDHKSQRESFIRRALALRLMERANVKDVFTTYKHKELLDITLFKVDALKWACWARERQ